MCIENVLNSYANKIVHQDAQNVFRNKIRQFANFYQISKCTDIKNYASQVVDITNALYPHINTLYYWMFALSKKYPEHLSSFLHLLTIMRQYNCSADLIEILGNDILMCLRRFPNLVSKDFYKNFETIIIPIAANGKSIFSFKGTRWFDEHQQKGGTGSADFAYKCYAMPFTPAGLHELIQMYKEVPAGNFNLFEQIRKDAILIGHHGSFGTSIGDMIHNSDPCIKELIFAMLCYYEKSDKTTLSRIQTEKLPNTTSVYNLDNYKSICENGEITIDVLQRLNFNLNNAKLYLPQIIEIPIQKELMALDDKKSISNMENVLRPTNKYIIEAVNSKKVGISPEFVQCCTWIDNAVFDFFNKMDFEMQFGIHTSECFKQILIFNELLNNPTNNFNVKEFDAFYNSNIVSNPTEMAFRAVARRQNELAIKLNGLHDNLKSVYNIDNQIVFSRKQRFWSGNMFSALQRLLPYKPASTVIGQKYRKEREELDLRLYSIIQNWNALMK